MTEFRNEIKEEYFNWLYDYVCKGRAYNNTSYKKLFMYLHQVEFTFFVRNDINRAGDGVDLRYRFAVHRTDDPDFQEDILYVLDGPCSVLEMIIALAIRCETTIMDNTHYGDRTSQWFWSMLTNLGIAYMDDERFDERDAEDIICTFLDRRYEPDGKGGLFWIKGCPDDLRQLEIWTQLCWYLDNFT